MKESPYTGWTTFSHGDPSKIGFYVRFIFSLDRALDIESYALAFHGFNQLIFNGRADSTGAKLYQAQAVRYCHPSRVKQSQCWENIGTVASANALIQLGRKKSVQAVNSGLSEHTPNQCPEADANKIAYKCQQIRLFRENKGFDQSEPLWRDCLGIVGHCNNGAALCQDWSSQHSGYDELKTSQKLTDRLKFPPTTCSQFRKSNPTGCTGCIEKCKSPIALGWSNEFKQEDSLNPNKFKYLLEALQRQYCLINISGKVWALDRSTLDIFSDQGSARKLSLSNRSDGNLLMTRTAKALSPEVDATKIIKEFFISPQTTCYQGVEFNPIGNSPDILNLWIGPTITPKQGTWELIKAYLLEVICDNHLDSYHYLISFLAHALQKPEEKPGVLVVLLGGQGTGKGTLARIISMIWNATYLHVHNIETVTGSFNAALERGFIVFMV